MDRQRQILKFIAFLLLAAVFWSAGSFLHFDAEKIKAFLLTFPPLLTAGVFVLSYVVLTSLIWLGPKDVLRIAAAYLWGAVWGTFWVWVAEMINAAVLFTFSRRLGRDFVAGRLRGRARDIDQTIADTRFWSIFFLRMAPVVPLRFLDLGFGLTRISIKKYLLIAALATPQRIFFTMFFLALGVETALDVNRLQAYLQDHPAVMMVSFSYFVVSLFLMVLVKKRFRKPSARGPGSAPG